MFFSDEKIDLKALEYMTPYHANQLTKDLKLGQSIMFSHHLTQWQESLKKNNSKMSASPHLSAFKSDFTSTNQSVMDLKIPQFILSEILLKSNEGRLINNYYKINSNFNEQTRSLLVEIIIQHLMETDVLMSVRLADAISAEIVKKFPTEVKVSLYFIFYHHRILLLLFFLFVGSIFFNAER